jgi:hypothetical protein
MTDSQQKAIWQLTVVVQRLIHAATMAQQMRTAVECLDAASFVNASASMTEDLDVFAAAMSNAANAINSGQDSGLDQQLAVMPHNPRLVH